MMRVLLFLATNLAVMLIAGIVLHITGLDVYLRYRTGTNIFGMLGAFFVIGMAGSVVSLFLSKSMAKMSTGTRIIQQPQNSQEQWLVDTVAELAQQAGIRMPDVGIFPMQQANAFATGWNRNSALVSVSEGLLNQMRPEEVRAVIGHEIGHVANGDMVTLALIQGVVNTFVMFFARLVAMGIDTFMRRNNEDRGLGQLAFFLVEMVMQVIFGIAASAIVAWFSRWREYRADAAGARLAGSGAMINALTRLKGDAQRPDEMPDSMTAFAITQGQVSSFMQKLFASHPPLDQRIDALKQAAYH